MKVRLLKSWDSLRASYWFLPTVMAAGAVALVVLMLRLDRGDQEWIGDLAWVYSGGPDGAREVLGTIAASMITVAGVVFSITIVALTLASQQFGPHILYSFMRDRGNQVVLGTFIATFLYCILVLRTVYGDVDGVEAFVPHLATTIGVVLAVVSLGVLIFFIHHVSMSIQAPRVIASLTDTLHHSISRFPDEHAGHDPTPVERHEVEEGLRGLLVLDSAPVRSDREGYIQAMDQHRMLEIASQNDLLLRIPVRQGLFVFRGAPIVTVAPAERLTPELAAEILGTIAIGFRRTSVQDLTFSFDQLAEIAVRALSTGINDPYTAADCVDRLGAALAHFMRIPRPSPYRLGADRRPRIILERPFTFASAADTAFNQIRQHMDESVSVGIRILEVIDALLPLTEDPDERAALVRHATMVHRAGMERFPEAGDRSDLEDRFEAIRRRRWDAEPAPGAP